MGDSTPALGSRVLLPRLPASTWGSVHRRRIPGATGLPGRHVLRFQHTPRNTLHTSLSHFGSPSQEHAPTLVHTISHFHPPRTTLPHTNTFSHLTASSTVCASYTASLPNTRALAHCCSHTLWLLLETLTRLGPLRRLCPLGCALAPEGRTLPRAAGRQHRAGRAHLAQPRRSRALPGSRPGCRGGCAVGV